MKYKIENGEVIATIESFGAELVSLVDKCTKQEYMWQADPKFLAKTSPILFPIVGALKNDTYYYDKKQYHLPRHGFARTKEWAVAKRSKGTVAFSLKSNNDTLALFPFQFELTITYKLIGKSLSVNYHVKNSSDETIYFSLGAHPAFACLTNKHVKYSDYQIQFEKKEKFVRWPINENGLIFNKPVSLNLVGGNILKLTYDLFYEDALVFKNLKSKWVKLQCLKSNKVMKFSMQEFPYLGIWASKNADFVCIEPWCGIVDDEGHNQKLEDKEGIVVLEPKADFKRKWNVTLL